MFMVNKDYHYIALRCCLVRQNDLNCSNARDSQTKHKSQTAFLLLFDPRHCLHLF